MLNGPFEGILILVRSLWRVVTLHWTQSGTIITELWGNKVSFSWDYLNHNLSIEMIFSEYWKKINQSCDGGKFMSGFGITITFQGYFCRNLSDSAPWLKPMYFSTQDFEDTHSVVCECLCTGWIQFRILTTLPLKFYVFMAI